ncbi:MAG: HAD hydrolase family protein [Verrucomicrobiota bacterium]
MKPRLSKSLAKKLARVKALLCDVDGVLTDGTVLIGGPEEQKRFHIQDGLGIVLARRVGIKVGCISRRPSSATEKRARELKFDFVHQSKTGKVAAVEEILRTTGVTWDEVCYVGDDVVDLAVMQRAGVAVAVANAIDDVKARSDYVTTLRGGEGAVREVIELLLRAQGKWEGITQGYLSGQYE